MFKHSTKNFTITQMKQLIIIFFLFPVLFLNAQDCYYENYYNQVDLAKENFNKRNYTEASKHFKKAFSSVDFPLGHDLSFALATAKEVNDEQWMENIAIQLAKGGIPLKYFNSYYSFNWHKTFKSNFKSYHKYYLDNFDIKLKERWVALLLKERTITEKHHEFREGKITLTLQEMKDDAYSLINELNDIVLSEGFPGEQKIGYLYIKGKNRIEPYNTFVLLRHIYQGGESIFKTGIPNLICSGKLLPSYQDILLSKNELLYDKGIEEAMTIIYNGYKKD